MFGVLPDFGKARGRRDPKEETGRGAMDERKDTGSGEDRYISIRIGNNNGSGMSMTYTFIQQTQLNHCKLSACVSFSSTVYYLLLLISLFKCSCSLWALSLQLQLPFCLSAIAVVKMEVARLVSHLAFLRVY